MYQVREIIKEEYILHEKKGLQQTIFQTSMWLDFLEVNQKIRPVILELFDGEFLCAFFVGGIVNKFGIKILGSPFEGWLTPDMGFVRVKEIDVNMAIKAVADYAFKNLHCLLVQIEDKNISVDTLDISIKYSLDKLLLVDINKSQSEIIEGFTSNGRRDVRASGRKNLEFKTVPFDEKFVTNHYEQLVDVFAKQNLKPFYPVEKLLDLVETFKEYPERVLAMEARLSTGENIASIFTFGYQKWGYYMGAASYRAYQKYLPNEGLFWEFSKFWNEQGIMHLDLVGYREYKLKYNPEIIEIPVILIEKYRGIIFLKNVAKRCIVMMRKLRGCFSRR